MSSSAFAAFFFLDSVEVVMTVDGGADEAVITSKMRPV
jgi:hypothetical protein